jgi:hypothetical protein
MAGWLLYNELGRMWKETVVNYSKVLLQYLKEG